MFIDPVSSRDLRMHFHFRAGKESPSLSYSGRATAARLLQRLVRRNNGSRVLPEHTALFAILG